MKLCGKGCERELLIEHVRRVFGRAISNSDAISAKLGRLDGKKHLKGIHDDSRACAEKIKGIQASDPLFLQIARVKMNKDLSASEKRALMVWDNLPEILERFGIMARLEVEAAAPLYSREGAKWMLLRYVEQATGSPRYEAVSGLLDAYAEENRIPQSSRGPDLSAEALRKFYRDRHLRLPEETGQNIGRFFAFLVRLLR